MQCSCEGWALVLDAPGLCVVKRQSARAADARVPVPLPIWRRPHRAERGREPCPHPVRRGLRGRQGKIKGQDKPRYSQKNVLARTRQ